MTSHTRTGIGCAFAAGALWRAHGASTFSRGYTLHALIARAAHETVLAHIVGIARAAGASDAHLAQCSTFTGINAALQDILASGMLTLPNGPTLAPTHH